MGAQAVATTRHAGARACAKQGARRHTARSRRSTRRDVRLGRRALGGVGLDGHRGDVVFTPAERARWGSEAQVWFYEEIRKQQRAIFHIKPFVVYQDELAQADPAGSTNNTAAAARVQVRVRGAPAQRTGRSASDCLIRDPKVLHHTDKELGCASDGPRRGAIQSLECEAPRAQAKPALHSDCCNGGHRGSTCVQLPFRDQMKWAVDSCKWE
jgi:hypothetical protein